MVRTTAVVTIIGFMLLAACALPNKPGATASTPTPSPAAAPSRDEYAIDDAVIEVNWPGRAVTVMDATTTIDYSADVRGYVPSQMPDRRKQTIDSFLAAQRQLPALLRGLQGPGPRASQGQAWCRRWRDP